MQHLNQMHYNYSIFLISQKPDKDLKVKVNAYAIQHIGMFSHNKITRNPPKILNL